MGVAAHLVLIGLALVPVGKTGARYDAEAHRIEARGVAAADPRTPSADVARVKAERLARADAANRLERALSALGWRGDEAALKRLVESATATAPDYGADGSVAVVLVLPTDGLSLKAPKESKER